MSTAPFVAYARPARAAPPASPAFRRALQIVTSARVRHVQAQLQYAVALSNLNHAPVEVFVERLGGGCEAYRIPADFSGYAK